MAPTSLTSARLRSRPSARRVALSLAIAALGAALSPPQASASRAVRPAVDAELLTHEIPRAAEEKTLSPYFVVLGEEDGTERLPLKMTAADVDIAGVIADVTVTQVYANTGDAPIEAKYVFPASTRAAVYGMTMTIGARVIEADIQRRAEARATYEQARAEGRSASLLEQERPNVFEMNVANIMPGDEIRVELRYTELLVPTDGIYEFVYPTVVGPRFSDLPMSQAAETDRFVMSPYLSEGEAPTYGFDFTATLSTGLPLQGVGSPSHEMDVDFKGPNLAELTLDESETDGGDRDVVLRYRLAGGKVESGLLLYEGEDESFFMLMAQPPRRVEPEDIPAREYIFVVDVSGSMTGFPLETSKALLKDLIGGLRPTDTFNVVLFASANDVMADRSVPATQANIGRALTVIDHQRGGGGTQLLPALKTAMGLPHTAGAARSIVVVTDGYISVEAATFDLIRQSLGDANVFAFGIGKSVNRHLIEGMARVGQGEPQVILSAEEAPAKADRFRAYIEAPVLTGVKATFQGMDVYDVDPPSIPDVLAQRPVVVVGKYRGKAQGAITLSGTSGEGAWSQRFQVEKVKALPENDALRYLWARQRIATLDDYNSLSSDPARVEEVTRLGLDYNLLTAYTSFVAVDSQRRNPGGEAEKVQQPLPLPEGVSGAAVGGLSAADAQRLNSLGYLGVTGSGYGGGGAAGGMAVATREASMEYKERSARPAIAPAPMRKAASEESRASAGPAPSAPAAATLDLAKKGDAPAKEPQGGVDKDTSASGLRLQGAATLSANLSAPVRGELDRQLSALKGWYQGARQRDPAFTGQLRLRLTLDASGQVVKAEAVGGDAQVRASKELAGLLDALRGFAFTAPTDGAQGQVTLTLLLG